MRLHLAANCCLALSVWLVGCDAPTAVSADRRVYETLLALPELSVGASRDSALRAQILPYRHQSAFVTGGGRVAWSAPQWGSLREWLELPAGLVPESDIDFAAEVAVLVTEGALPFGGTRVEIRHVTLARDTLFVLAAVVGPGEECAIPALVTSPWDARVVPRTAFPIRFLIGRYRFNCRTLREEPVW